MSELFKTIIGRILLIIGVIPFLLAFFIVFLVSEDRKGVASDAFAYFRETWVYGWFYDG